MGISNLNESIHRETEVKIDGSYVHNNNAKQKSVLACVEYLYSWDNVVFLQMK